MMTRSGKPPLKIKTLTSTERSSLPLTQFLGKMASMSAHEALQQAIERSFQQELAKIASQLGIRIPVTNLPR